MLVLSHSPWFKVAEVHMDHEKARLGIIWKRGEGKEWVRASEK